MKVLAGLHEEHGALVSNSSFMSGGTDSVDEQLHAPGHSLTVPWRQPSILAWLLFVNLG